VASTSASASSTSIVGQAKLDLASIVPLTSHASLVDVSHAIASKNHRAAADALKKVLDAGTLKGDDATRARFLHGRLLVLAKDDDAADVAYALVPESSPLFAHASVRRAALAAKKGKGDDALSLVEKVPDAAPFTVDRHMASADALSAKGDHQGAATAYASEKKGPRWVDASIRYAEEVAALGKAGEAMALDAGHAARRVRFEVPTSSLVPRAEDAEKKCKALLPPSQALLLGAPTTAEQTTMAQALLDAGKGKDALATIGPLLASLPKGKEAWCKATLVAARAHERLRERTKASDVYGQAAASCTDEATRTTALYDGAKIAISAKLVDVARQRFATLESAYPKHRLADDARVRGANAAIEAGDVTKGEAMLSSLPDDYPSGDMKSEALFRLALPRMKKGSWSAALPYLEKSIALTPHDDGYFVAGRAAYFLARAKIETGAVADGIERLRKVIAEEPLTFASAMAYARLCARGATECASAKKSLEDGIAAEPAGPLYSLDRTELTTPAFARAVELARVGEVEMARKELAVAGLLKDASTDPEGQWIVSALFARVGEAKASHGFARNRLTDWTKHFPGGRWRTAWEIAFPKPYADFVSSAASKESVPTALVWAVMREESAFDPDVVSPSMAYGLMQLILPTAAAYAKPLKLPSDAKALTDPANNIPIGTAFLRKLRGDFPQNPALVVPSYNAGEGATKRWMDPPLADSFDLWVESIPFDETRKYTKRVLASYYAYIALYDAGNLDSELRNAAGK